jgi:hypothetical protein
MKKRFLILIMAAIWLMAISSKDIFAMSRLTLGLKGGINSANLKLSFEGTELTYQARFRLIWGGFVGVKVSNRFTIQAEAYRSPKGSKILETLDGVPTTVTLMYDYLEFPLLVKYSQPSFGKATTAFFAGPYVAFKQSAKQEISTFGEGTTEDLTGQKAKDYGLVFGFSVDYKIGKAILIADIRYSLGLTDVDKAPESTIRHRVLAIMGGIGF